ncbi:MAG: NADH:ubiquinone reductase (Na(+)-transporting) subunit C [Bacteroidota bacterium]
MTTVIGGVLSLTSQLLSPAQQRSIEKDTKSQILSAVIQLEKKDDVLGIYNSRIKSFVVDFNGNIIENNQKGNPIIPEKVNVLKNFKKDLEERELPVFQYMNEADSNMVDAYILPLYGKGLWNNIYGFIALESDLNTVKGISLGHVAETPGLGARISDKDVQDRYKEKTIFEGDELVSIMMLKGEKNDPSLFGPHEVDGLSASTLTANGVNAMLKEYLDCYKGFIEKTKNQAKL